MRSTTTMMAVPRRAFTVSKEETTTRVLNVVKAFDKVRKENRLRFFFFFLFSFFFWLR